MTDLYTLAQRLRGCAKWGTMTSEFNAKDRIEWIAADAIELLMKKNDALLTLLEDVRNCGGVDCEWCNNAIDAALQENK